MSDRETVLKRITLALDRPPDGPLVSLSDQPESVRSRLHAAHRHTLPAIGASVIDTLVANMESVLMSVVRVQAIDNCVAAVSGYLDSEGIDIGAPGAVTVAPALHNLAWPDGYNSGAATGRELVSITPCLAAVAETGSIVTVSGPATPVTLNFLPETHIIIVHESQVVRYVDDVFPLLRSHEVMPRAVNLVTGPSRTADIEQTLEIGAHGPRRMHVLLVSADHDA